MPEWVWFIYALVALLGALGTASRWLDQRNVALVIEQQRLNLDQAFAEPPEEDYFPCPNCNEGTVGEGDMAVDCPRCAGLAKIPESELKPHERKYLGLE